MYTLSLILHLKITPQALKSSSALTTKENYIEWKNDLTIWQMYTDINKCKQCPAVFLSLTGRARDCVRDLQPQEIGQENGVKKIDKPDTFFFKK